MVVAFSELQFALCPGHQRFRFAPPLRDVAAQFLARAGVIAGLQAIAVAEWRSNPWVPDVVRPQHLDR